MESSYSPISNIWNMEWPGRVSQHDVVYLSPPVDPLQGLPIGNGDIGLLLWAEGNRLIAAVNKCDTWDDNEEREFHNWGKSEEENHTRRIINKSRG